MHKIKRGIYFLLIISIALSVGYFVANQQKTPGEIKIGRLIKYIQNDYVDAVDTEQILEETVRQIMGKLDPHSRYIPKEYLAAMTEKLQGEFVGIGIQFRMVKDSVTVLKLIKGGPCEKSGIQAGDRILVSDKDTLYGKNLRTDAVPKFLKGRRNTEVELWAYRKSNDSLFSVKVIRGSVPIKSVQRSFMLTKEMGYIKLERFARTSANEFRSALQDLLKKGMKTLVFDLRENGGGFINIASQIADEFLEKDKLIVFTKDKNKTTERSYATENGSFKKGKIYVLINENSASASEIVAGALQDHDRATLVGRRSFGKGLVQEERYFGDGSAIRLTTAKYYTPTGRSIQKPYKKGQIGSYSQELFSRISSGELLHKDSIKTVDSLKFKTPKGKIVYGGGGIVPDVFVPVNIKAGMSSLYFNSMSNFVFSEVDKNRKMLKATPLAIFLKSYNVDKLYKTYIKYLSSYSRGGFTPLDKNQKNIKIYLKALVADNVYGEEAFLKVLQPKDMMLKKVLKLEKRSSRKKSGNDKN